MTLLLKVFPAYAGVFPRRIGLPPIVAGLPRIRGGVSHVPKDKMELLKSSPHTRGCFSKRHRGSHFYRVFPAYAGVFLALKAECLRVEGLPRIRGGVSAQQDKHNGRWLSSPHTRGCFYW